MTKLVFIQKSQLTEEFVPKYIKDFVSFDIFANRLNNFIISNLSTNQFDILPKLYVFNTSLSYSQLWNVVLAQIRKT